MARAPRLPRPRLAVERFKLANGLRVVVMPDRSAPAVGISVTYDVGFRSEPEGRTGFAHLFEHLMFQGSVSLDKREADRLIEGNGGDMNGSTHADYTNYISELPSNALELGLYLEADRMRGVRLTEENLRNQIDVVKEEIRVNVLNRPYGGFPWIDLPPVMFQTFNNAHNGYGSFTDLESATVDDAAEFFARYYCPANAVLALAGDVDTADAQELVERHFGDIARRPAPPQPDLGEPRPSSERRATKADPLAPLPAVAVGYRVPDPINEIDAFAALLVTGEVLAGGEASRLYQRLVKRDRLATHVFALMGTFGDPFDVRDPTMLQFLAYLPPGTDVAAVVQAIDEEVERTASGLSGGDLSRAVTTMVSDYIARLDPLLERSIFSGVLEQQRRRAEWINDLPGVVDAVTADAAAAAAGEWLAPSSRAVLEVVPGAAS